MSISYSTVSIKPYPRKPIAPYRPNRFDYIDVRSSDGNVIYRDIECDALNFSWDKYCRAQDIVAPLSEKRYHEGLTLQDVVDLAPPGTKLSDIMLWIHFNMEYAEITFVHKERDIELEDKLYAEALAKFEKEYTAYEANLAAYEAAIEVIKQQNKQAQIEALEKQLAQLKRNP